MLKYSAYVQTCSPRSTSIISKSELSGTRLQPGLIESKFGKSIEVLQSELIAYEQSVDAILTHMNTIFERVSTLPHRVRNELLESVDCMDGPAYTLLRHRFSTR